MAVSSSDSTRALAVPSPTHPGFRGGVLPQLQGELDGEPPHHNAGLGMEYPVSTDTMRQVQTKVFLLSPKKVALTSHHESY
jgi:hypothetical protein